jgi:methylmalonyl-CoA mutase C-terminal domain/subunit
LEKKIRILLAKPGLDGHDKGIRILARALMDAGMEVIYLGLRQSPEDIARAAAQEEPSVIGLSILSGAHVNLTRKVIASLGKVGCGDIPVIVGGTIAPNDVKLIREAGAAAVFGMGTPLNLIVSWIKQNVQKQRKEAERFS